MEVLKDPMGVLKRVNGDIEKNPVGVVCRVNGGIGHGERVNGGIEKGQWGHWSGSIVVLKRVIRGVGQSQWAGSMRVLNNGGSMGVLKRINGGIGQDQWGY